MDKEFVNIKENGEEITVKAVHHSEVSNETHTSSITTYEDGTIVAKVGESQLDKMEKKVDRILELLEGKELSISFDGKKVAESLNSYLDELNHRHDRLRKRVGER